MSEREYIVSLKRGVDPANFQAEMTQSTGNTTIPQRSVDIANERLLSQRNTHYSLSEEEAQDLKNDDRVVDVAIPPEQDDSLKIGHRAIQTGDFQKTSADSGNHINWGLRRCIESTNPYGTSTADPSGEYTYNLDGTGVDVVIQDSGLQIDHPDFNDTSGVSRVQNIDWYTESGLSGTQNANHNRDYDGHGTHVAGIAAGLTYGWAKNSRIYHVKVNGLEGSGDSGTGIAVSDCFDVIKGWHNNKPVDPTTGFKRPTIVNMSWGYSSIFSNITGGNYRGTAWTGTSRETQYGMVGAFTLSGYAYVTRVASVDTDVQEMIDAGIHICIAAGNSYQKIDIPTGQDYDNYFNHSVYGARYYHRGGSPTDDQAITVGNIDSATHSGGLEQKASSSENGPGVDIYAQGSNIMSTTSTTNRFTDGDYPPNSSFRVCNIGGTSMASPQVCGVGALLLQANPHMTPDELKAFIISQSGSNLIYSTGLDFDYTDSRSLKGSVNRFLVNPFSSQYKVRITQS